MGVILALTLFAAPVAVAHTGATYDAQAHALSAHGAAAADLRTPSATVARVKAEREARAQAAKKLAAALAALGGPRDPDVVDKKLEEAKVSDERFGSDGSVELTLTLSTEGMTLKRHHHKKKERE